MSSKSPARPARFRRRLALALVLASLLPLLALGAVAGGALGALLDAVSFAPMEDVLEGAQNAVQSEPKDAEQRLREARLLVAQAELARRALGRRVPWLFGGAVALAAAGAALAAWALSRSFARPLGRLTEAISLVAAGELERRVPVQGDPARDELAFLHLELDRMSDQLLAQRRRLEISQRLGAWQEVARAMAHELKNPLTAIKMGLARLSRVDPAGRGEADQARLSESLSLLEEQVEALMRMTQSFSDFARLPAMAPRPVQLRALVADVCALFREQGGPGVKLADGEEVALQADPDQLRRALVNLLKNAVEAGGASAPDVEVAVRADRERAQVVIRDRGAGVPRQLRMGQFVEGGSQKPGGSGLGLPITQKILHEHGGSLRLDPAEGGGTVATVELPIAPEGAR